MLKRFFHKMTKNQTRVQQKKDKSTSKGKTSTFRKPWTSSHKRIKMNSTKALDEVNETVREAARTLPARPETHGRRPLSILRHTKHCGNFSLQLCVPIAAGFSFISPEEGPISHPPAKRAHHRMRHHLRHQRRLCTRHHKWRLFAPKFQKKMSNTSNFPGPTEEIQRKRESRAKEETGICSWCEKSTRR